jgi:tetratricopeptide (TPR) repeat protein
MEKKPTVTIQNNNPKQSYNSVSSYSQNLITQDKEKSLKFNRINTVMDSNMKNKADKKSNKNNFFNQSNLLSIFGIKGGEEGKVSEHKSSNFQDDAQNLDPQVVNKKITELSDKNSRAQSQHNNSFGEKEPKHKKKVFEYKEDFYSLLKRAEQIDTNRKIIKENYIKSGRNKMSIINKWKEILKNMKYFDVALYIHCFKILGDIKIEFDEYELAKNNYLCHKYLAYRLELLDELMLGYEGLGHVYKFLYQYHKAIKCYKKQIEIAWYFTSFIKGSKRH